MPASQELFCLLSKIYCGNTKLLLSDGPVAAVRVGMNDGQFIINICRKRGIPIFTFMNKLDRPAKFLEQSRGP